VKIRLETKTLSIVFFFSLVPLWDFGTELIKMNPVVYGYQEICLIDF